MRVNKKILRRTGLGLLAAVAALLLLELLLQAGALIVAFTGRAGPGEWRGESIRMLSLGDSNTYGLYLERDQAYPALLEWRWNETHDSPKIEVINLGYPGNNSSKILAELPQALTIYEPDILTLMVGVNDFWTPPPESAGGEQARPSAIAWLRQHSRLFKLFYMIKQQLAGPAIGPRAEADSPDMERLRRNILKIAELAREHEATLYLLTYPNGEIQAIAGEQLREVAGSLDLGLIDIEEAFRAPCAGGCDNLLFFDNHPKEGGHALIADTILRALE
jgi:lysophospholipase L1-like esterase